MNAGQPCDHASAGRELPEVIRQIADHLIIRGVAELVQHRSEVFLRQQFVPGPGCQPAPGNQQKPGGTDGQKIARPCEQHGVAQRAFILDAAGLPCRSRRKREALPPGSSPPLLPAHHRVERTDGGACGERDVLKGI